MIINNFWNKIKVIVDNAPGLTIGLKDKVTSGELYIYHGKTSDMDNANVVDSDTRFDLASVTKLPTALRLLKAHEMGHLDLSKPVKFYAPQYHNIDGSLLDVSKFYYQINTDGRLDTASSKEELEKRLLESKAVLENTFVYSDIPYIILGEVLNNIGDNFDNVFHDELGMIKTSYDVRNKIITGGNRDSLDSIHDPKAQKMKEYGYKEMGHAGLYSTSSDLVKLGDSLLPGSSFLSDDSIAKLRTPSRGEGKYYNVKSETFKNKNRGMGVYIQTENGIRESDISIDSSRDAFAASGTTGPYILVDPTNNFTFNYLTNPYSQEGGAPVVNYGGQEEKWAGLTNVIKEELMNLVYELRFAANVYDSLAKEKNSEDISVLNEQTFKSNRTVRR